MVKRRVVDPALQLMKNSERHQELENSQFSGMIMPVLSLCGQGAALLCRL